MDQFNIFRTVADSEVAYPILFIPKKCTTLETNCDASENVYIDLNITSPDTDGNETRIYSGYCNVKLVDSNFNFNHNSEPQRNECNTTLFDSDDIDQMPIILSEANQFSFPSYNQSQVWIDPSRSPYVYNNYDAPAEERYSFHEARGCITVKQHNTYITQNIYNYKESNVYNYREHQPSPNNEYEHKNVRKIPETTSNQQSSGPNLYEEDEFQCGVFLSQLPEEIINEEMSRAQKQCKQQSDNALKQLMATQSTAKERKTILFLGHDSHSGQTIQNISYNDPKVKCAELEVDNEVIIDHSSSSKSKKKKYQCDKCKQIFNRISAFRKHMISSHNNGIQSQDKGASFMCPDCGRNLKSQRKFDTHCLGHGDPNLECQKCLKVFASKFTLRTHQKIHDRKYPCTQCVRSYPSTKELNAHLEKSHFVFKCKYDDCSFVSSRFSQLDNHHKSHLNQISTDSYFGDTYMGDISDEELVNDVTEEGNLKSEEFVDLEENDAEGRRIRMADSVISKVMSNKIFLLNAKMAKKHGRFNKSCEVCRKSFDRVGDLKRHLIEHIIKSTLAKSPVSRSGALNIVCEICQTETFNKVDKYKAHLREHAKLTIYKCTFCDKSFSDSSNFSKHKKIHGVAYLQCDLCQRKFNSKKMIAQHMEYHNKNKPIKCRFCFKSFHFESTLKKHIKCMHNKETGTKFRCKFCDTIFKTLKDKWDHEWTVHNVRKMVVDCLICGSKFRKYSELKRHCHDEHDMGIPSAKKLLKKKVYYK